MTKDNRIYKIRNIETGLYSTGGMFPRWTRAGKTWSGLGPLRSHLGHHTQRTHQDISKWRVVEIEVQVKAEYEIHEMLNQTQMLRLLKQDYNKS